MNPKLVGCLLASVLVGATFASAAVFSGWGLLVGFAAYSFTGSMALVPIALWAFQDNARDSCERAAEPARACA